MRSPALWPPRGLLAAERHGRARARASWSGSRSRTSRLRWSETSARSPRPRSAAASAQGRQLPLRRLRPRLPHQGGAADHDRRPDPAPVARPGRGHRPREAFETLERMLGVDLDKEGDRFAAREVIGAILKSWTITAPWTRSAMFSTRTASVGAPTRRSWELVDGTPAARPKTRSSRRLSSLESAPTRLPGSPYISATWRCARPGRRCSASTLTRLGGGLRPQRAGDRPSRRPISGSVRPRTSARTSSVCSPSIGAGATGTRSTSLNSRGDPAIR